MDLKWTVGYSRNIDTAPKMRVPASVPGAVQLDWARYHNWGDYTYADNWKDYLWMEDVYWSYITKLVIPELLDGQRLFFVCKGVDYRFQVKLKNEIIHDQEGMFTPFEIDLTGRTATDDSLEVLVFPAPKSVEIQNKRQADQSCKPAVSYGWDWHPRLIPLGIWDDTYLEVRPACHIISSEVFYVLDDDFTRASVKLDYEVSKEDDLELVWRLLDKSGQEINSLTRTVETDTAGSLFFDLDNPELWWPNGHGESVLYTSIVELTDKKGIVIDRKHSKVGFRKAQLVMHQGAWSEPENFPKSRSNPPITMEVNGKQIFCKGSNWVNPEIFPGIVDRDTYLPLVTLAKEAHMNLFRIWGGGIVNKEAFFELCDEQGIMVWQEFPLACNNYIGTPEYLRVLDQESRSIIKRLRSHACMVLWCGGNELFNSWSGMTDQSLALRLLNRNCYDLDPKTPYIMTSPLAGMAHGNYIFRYHNGEEVFQAMSKASNTAYTEFGCAGPSPADYIKTFIPEDELFPPKRGTAWQTHHAYDAWWPGSDTWLQEDVIEHYFGPSNTLEELTERGMLLQSEGYKCIYEEARRQKPKCSMALNWCWNEPWPTAAGNSLLNWPAIPKPSYYAVKASCRPVVASARIAKFTWRKGELFNPELWILNDTYNNLQAGRIEAYLRIDDKEEFLLGWDYPAVSANTNLPGPVIRYNLSFEVFGRITLVLKNTSNPEMDSEYILLYGSKEERAYSMESGITNL